uniref:Isocitrate dehydrogenase (NADP(+)) n=1 Tax=Leptocylindrus danicus TaxID=163516 RepID=A0A7S2KDV6_9STRA|mmetsp:Transcript_21749/g.32494  ORF Transcript_21749/g.32494 Transcript_21749/m.32494 type:complete len:828 (+) Transcript_21749:96-2579(+)|eukprot:CAMPEP_0116008350 /NCGR_PEP_ID=MMETSP0321-20121206/2814_1 /TAXON_ID=163516 /ORGANISM="Leptocylindrus danicus var. danicus, Strain B650" /LENGTH=827 /DNA_ID=CAMNT_0003477163 /DNA_START=53 /DNA_END=2536 /DNA_ORIENTATION=-
MTYHLRLLRSKTAANSVLRNSRAPAALFAAPNVNLGARNRSFSTPSTISGLSLPVGRSSQLLISRRWMETSSGGVEVPPAPTSLHAHTPIEGAKGRIIYTETDEAPALATYSLLPVFSKFGGLADIDVVPCDISVAGRVLAAFPEKLRRKHRVPDNLAYLGELCKTPEANVIKLPNISASIPQLEACIKELRDKGYDVPLYPREPEDEEEEEIKERYAKVLGSAVNPVLREGNSDRRVAAPVKAYAQKNPHKMGIWSKASKTHVAFMDKGDFYSSEKSAVAEKETDVAIELVDENGNVTVLKESTPLLAGEVFDASFMDVAELDKYFEREISEAKETELLLSLHLKATMMKVSDPIMFGHCVKVFYKDAFAKHNEILEEIGADPKNGLASVYGTIEQKLSADQAAAIKADFEACYESRPWLAMVNSDKGITNLHVPSDVIIDASMPVVIRDSGMMWNKIGELEDTKCLIPDRCYATMYQEAISFCKTFGQFDVATMGNVANVGLMAQKAEEYGSHDKTFEIAYPGTVRVKDNSSGEVYFEHNVNTGDIWRMCQTKDVAIRDWVKLAVARARATGSRTIFWLDSRRAHDATLINKVNTYLQEHDLSGLDISIMKPSDAIRISMERARDGQDTISVTGNVLRDYLTDLFPIIELGTSAKMLSIVPLLSGGGLYETGAGGSAPKHVQQFLEEGHLRWDSLGEYLATAVAFAQLGETTGNEKAKMLGDTLNQAIGRLLDNRKSPSRRVGEIDNRATNYYVALYWAEYLSKADPAYAPVFQKLSDARADIVEEFKASQDRPMDIGGYYRFNSGKANDAMRPSKSLNAILDDM